MGRQKATVQKRLRDYSDEGFESKNNRLWCSLCSTFLDFEKKSTIDNHVTGKVHLKFKSSANLQKPVTATISEQFRTKEIWSSMAVAFVSAGVPLHVFSNPSIREWIKKNCTAGETLPSEQTLRNYLVEEGKADQEKTINFCESNDVILMVDESQDIHNRKLLNILVSPALPEKQFRLVQTDIMLKCNAQMVGQRIIAALSELKVPFNRVVGFVTSYVSIQVAK